MSSIYTRVSVRKYQDKPVEKAKIEAILRAAMPSRTAMTKAEFTGSRDER